MQARKHDGRVLHALRSESIASSVTEAEVVRVLALASTAPSANNNQPFAFAMRADGFDVVFDASRGKTPLDPWEAFPRVTLGALLENARLAGQTLGLVVAWCLDPGPEPTVWARVSMTRGTPAIDSLATQLEARHTNRAAYDGRPLGSEVRATLLAERGEADDLRVVDSTKGLREVGALIGMADRLRAEDRACHEDLHANLRWDREQVEGSRDGLDARTLGITAVQRAFLKVTASWSRMRVAIHLGAGRLFASQGRTQIESSSAVLCVTTQSLDAAELVEAGRTFQRVWLRATELGLAVCPLGAVTMLGLRGLLMEGAGLESGQDASLVELGRGLKQTFGVRDDSLPLVLLRVGYADASAVRALRRTLRESCVTGGRPM